MNPIKERLYKLLELSRQGVGGERENAEAMLTRLLEKNNMTLADLESHAATLEAYYFTFKDKEELKLLYQTAYAVVGSNEYPAFKCGTSKRRRLMLTRAQGAEMQIRFEILVRHFRAEKKTFFSAFIMKNDIYPVNREPDPDFKPTQAQLEAWEKAKAMSRGIDKANIFKALEGGK